jgi:hypothetical protein
VPVPVIPVCTHYQKWDEFGKKVSFCKEFLTQDTCDAHENYYHLLYANNGCSTNDAANTIFDRAADLVITLSTGQTT